MSGPLRKSLGSLAAVAALSAPSVAPATIQVSALSNISLPNSGSYAIDIDGDTITDFTINPQLGFIEGIFFNGGPDNAVAANGGGLGAATLYGAGQSVSGTLDFNAGQVDMSSFHNSSFAYLAFTFNVGSSERYGWMQFSFPEPDDLLNGTLHAAAWEDSGAAIATGAVPEPAHAAVGGGLLAGILAFLRRRRQRKQQA